MKLQFDTLDATRWAELCTGATELARDAHGAKVLRTPDGRIIKLFRIKRLLTLNRLVDPARRFAAAAECLHAHGFATVRPERLLRLPAIARTAVVYPELAGDELRALRPDPVHARALGGLWAALHGQGLLFRSLHLGNVLALHRGTAGGPALAIIDVADLRSQRAPLRMAQRLRNVRHIARYAADLDWLDRAGLGAFEQGYAAAGDAVAAQVVTTALRAAARPATAAATLATR